MRRLWFIFGVITYLCWLFVWISTTLSFGIRSGRGIETYLLVFRLEIIRKVKENRAERRERKGEWEGWFISSRWSGQSVLVTKQLRKAKNTKKAKKAKAKRETADERFMCKMLTHSLSFVFQLRSKPFTCFYCFKLFDLERSIIE